MLHILLVAATKLEITPCLEQVLTTWEPIGANILKKGDTQLTLCITGIGCMKTAYELGKQFANNRPNVALQAGVGGTFNPEIALGQVVLIEADAMADLGLETALGLENLFDRGICQESIALPYERVWLVNNFQGIPYLPKLPMLKGVTVNLLSTNLQSIQKRINRYNPAVESMEGAAFHYACLVNQVPFFQLRAISNYVVDINNKKNWKISLAIQNLNDVLCGWVKTVCNRKKSIA